MRGSQEPRIRIEPERIGTDGADAALLMSEYGSTLDPWQRDIVNCWLGKDKAGKYNATSAGLSVPRQNGKNVCIEAREFFGMVVKGEKILHTAHQVKTGKRSFRRLAAMFTDKRHPEITDLVTNIRYTNGEEGIELENGGMIEFSARSRQAARGFDGISVLVLDEAQELTDDQLEAILATLAASPTGTRQIIYAGTPPYPNCPGTVFRRRRNICLTDPGNHSAWHEWSVAADNVNDINLPDKSLWYNCNPSMGIHLTEEFTEEEHKTMSPDGFARERLGWWSPVIINSDYCINKDEWDACASEKMKPEGKTAFGVKFSPDGATVSLCGAVISKDNEERISLIECKSTGHGTQWLADWLNKRYNTASCVVIDGKNGVDVLISKIKDVWKSDISIIRPNKQQVIAAASLLVNEISEKRLTWYKGQDLLRDSAINAVKRPISGGWGFGGENSTPIEAAALALYGVKTSKRTPGRKMLIG